MKKEHEQGKAAGLLLIMHLKLLVARRRRRKEALTNAAVACQSRVRKRQAGAKVVKKRQFMQTAAAMAIQHSFRVMRRVGWRTKRHNYLRQIQAVSALKSACERSIGPFVRGVPPASLRVTRHRRSLTIT